MSTEIGLETEGEEITFEDWIKRKQLHATDQNYVNAFRFFEKREQQVGMAVPYGGVAKLVGGKNPLKRK